MDDYFAQGRWQYRCDLFSEYKMGERSVVMLGNSLTENFECCMHDSRIYNMGISGDFTKGILMRIDQVIKLQPKVVFLMIGINDIIEKVPLMTVEKNYIKIVEKLKKEIPDLRLVIQSNLPVYNRESLLTGTEEINDLVEKMNQFLESYCKENKIEYLNLYSMYVKNDQMNSDLTNDGIHLTEKGYAIWKAEIEKLIADLD